MRFCLFAFALPALAAQELRLHGLFDDHMVLPHGTEVPWSGVAAAGAVVEVQAPWLAAPVRTVAGSDGAFSLRVATPAPGGPFRVEVRSGPRTLVLEDVLVGDVWLCSGQSNMEMPVGPCAWSKGTDEWQQELATADLPKLRVLTIAHRAAATPAEELGPTTRWQVCTKETATAFSAIAFFFGRELLRRRPVPLGLVVSCWGGTVAEAWMSSDALASFPEFRERLAALPAGPIAREQRRARFWAAIAAAQAVAGAPEVAAFEDNAWESVRMPHRWSEAGLSTFDGVGWYRRRVSVPTAWRGRELLLQLGPIDDMDTVWVEGRRVAGREEHGHWQEPRNYRVPGELVRGEAITVVVRVVDSGGEGGFGGTAESLRLSPLAGEGGAVDLAGEWRFRTGPRWSELPALPSADVHEPNRPTVLWNGMIAPLVPFPFCGAIWYQGEANVGRADQYARLLPALVADWRRAFGSELAFCLAQIAPFGYRDDRGQLFDLRRAQEAVLRLPRTGMAVTTDVGDPHDIHPTNKRAVGERLAWQALAAAHGERGVPVDAPRPQAVRIEAGAVVVDYPRGSGLRTTNAGPHHFEVAGSDGVFRPAVASVVGDVVILRCAEVVAPAAVRYCYTATALADLWGGDGLPAVPFLLPVGR